MMFDVEVWKWAKWEETSSADLLGAIAENRDFKKKKFIFVSIKDMHYQWVLAFL